MTANWTTIGAWFGPTARPLMGWVTGPVDGRSGRGALILPPLGYEYMTAHRTLRTIAEQLAAAGCTALRIDYDGTGDSGGDQWDPDRVAAWRQSVGHGVEELHRLGCDDVCIVGLRFGATLALLEAARANAQRVVAWAPVVSGRRYVRELRMLGIPADPSADRPDLEGTLSVAGFVFSAETLRDLAAVDLEQLAARPAPSVLLIERPDGSPMTRLADHLTELGCHVDVRAIDGTEHCLDEPAEFATVPGEIVGAISDWVVNESPASSSSVHHAGLDEVRRDCAELSGEGTAINECVARFGPRDLVGIVGNPAGTARATIVWANSGSETHIGPGRAWVEFSRELNRAGFRTIRLDCRGWGESPDDGFAPARPYDPRMEADLLEVVVDVETRGWGPVVLAGLCAGAWMALEVARTTLLGGVIAISPQLYWIPGSALDLNMAATHERRAAERKRIERLGRFKLWWLLDVLGSYDRAARCLHDINEHGTPTFLLFGHGDDGLEYLEHRAGRALARAQRTGRIEVFELPGIDHGMHRAWLRHEVSDAIFRFLEPLVPTASSAQF